MAGLLDTFTISKRGLTVQQSNINTSSHNIANANTEGFSRQRSVIKTTRPFGGMSRFDMCSAGQVGTGAQVAAIQRVRNLFLDYQVRDKMSQTGTADIKYTYLYQAESILNDSSDAGIQNALNKFFDKFQELSKTPESTTNRDNAMSQAQSLANLLNSKYTQLEKKKEDMQKLLKSNVSEINEILDNINSLNKQIRSVAVVGMAPNDLMDERDLLLDKLSSKFGIEVDRDKDETINLSMSEWTYSIGTGSNAVNRLVSSDPNQSYLRFAAITSINAETNASGAYTGKIELEYGDGDNVKTLTLTGITDVEKTMKTLQENRVLLTNQNGELKKPNGSDVGTYDELKAVMFSQDKGITKGEIIGNIQAQQDIQQSMDELDELAATLAYTVNAIQTGSRGTETPLKYANGNDAESIFVVRKDDGSQTGSDTGITAKNISVNSKIIEDSSLLICGESISDVSGTKAGTRALAIANLATTKIALSKLTGSSDYADRQTFFTNTGAVYKDTTTKLDLVSDSNGTTMKDYYISITGKLGIKIESTKDELTTCAEELQEYDEQRMSESGVSLDEEMTDLITFQHAYQANAKMINTIDQLLDVVINGLKA